jgi:hypothetical protein
MSTAIIISYLEEPLMDCDQNLPLFIIGDLNIDLKSEKGNKLINFMTFYNLKNAVKSYTRIEHRYYLKYNKNIKCK